MAALPTLTCVPLGLRSSSTPQWNAQMTISAPSLRSWAISFFIYYVLTANELIDKLGIVYKTSAGSLEVNACRMRYGDVFFVPSRLLWYDVERIGDGAFSSPKNAALREVYIPKTIKSIGKDVFSLCDSLEALRFEGSEEEWQAIENESELCGVVVTFDAVYPISVQKKK